jgi:hypothetical protein
MAGLRALGLRLLLGAGLLASAAGLPNVVALQDAPVATVIDQSGLEAQFLQLANGDRARSGLAPLVADAALGTMARNHAQAQASQGRIFHASKVSLLDRCEEVAENVGRGISPEQIHGAFMASPVHRSEILGRYDRVGVGVAAGDSLIYVTEVFCRSKGGTPAPAPDPVPAPAPVKRAVVRRAPVPKPPAPPVAPEVPPAPAPAPPPVVSSGMGSPCRLL